MAHKTNKPKVVILHNVVIAFRTEHFETFAKRCDLEVIFCEERGEFGWRKAIGRTSFRHRFLKKLKLGFYVCNPGLFWVLVRTNADVYVMSDNEENTFSNLCLAWFCMLKRKPYVLWTGHLDMEAGMVHPIDFHDSFLHRWPIKNIFQACSNRMNEFLYRHANSYLAYSERSKQYLVNRSIKPELIVAGGQALSPTLLPAATQKMPLNPKKLQLLYLGIFRPEKGIDILIKACRNLPPSKFELHIVGMGPKEQELRDLAAGVSAIQFHPFAGPAERANWYASVDFSILPTYFDPWARVIPESLHYGTPVITAHGAAASSAIEAGRNGFVFETGNIDALHTILQKLTANPPQAKQLKQFKLKRHTYNMLFDLATTGDNFMEAIELARRSGR